jgi:hypothetical protein
MKYALYATLFLFLASCAPKPAVPPGKSGPASKAYMEERVRSKDAVDKVDIGGTGTALYYDRRQWTVKSDGGSRIEFNPRRFTNARIFAYDEAIPMTHIYRKLVDEYGLQDARLVESEFVRVNGQAVVFNKIEGKQGRKQIVILSYGFSDEGRTIIAHAHIFKGMLRDETEREIVDFLNGFVVGG